jgi:hypothetical protein
MGNQNFLFNNLHGTSAHCAKWFKPGSLPKAIRPVRLQPACSLQAADFQEFWPGRSFW